MLPNIHSVFELAKGGAIDYKEMNMIGDLLPYLSEEGRDHVEANFADFLEAVAVKAKKTDATWQEILKHFDYIPEIKKIQQFAEDKDNNLSEEQRREIDISLQVNVA